MLVAILYAFVRLLLDVPLLQVRSRPSVAHDIELLALRQEVRVLRPQRKRARYHPGDLWDGRKPSHSVQCRP